MPSCPPPPACARRREAGEWLARAAGALRCFRRSPHRRRSQTSLGRADPLREGIYDEGVTRASVVEALGIAGDVVETEGMEARWRQR